MRLIRLSRHPRRRAARHPWRAGYGPSYGFDRTALQAGSDVLRLDRGEGMHPFGLMGACGLSDMRITPVTGLQAGNDQLSAWAAGAYWTWYGAPGWTLDAVTQATCTT